MKKNMEYNTDKEFESLPSEYLQGGEYDADIGNNVKSASDAALDGNVGSRKDAEKFNFAVGGKEKSSRKRMLYLAAVFSLAAYVTAGAFDIKMPVSAETVLEQDKESDFPKDTVPSGGQEPEGGQELTEEKKPDEEQEASILPESSLAEKPENIGPEALPVYPLEDGTDYYVVYNDTYGYDNEQLFDRILEEGFLFESQLTQGIEYALPEYEPAEGYVFMGWVVYYDKTNKSAPSMGMVGDSLKEGNVCLIKPEDGTRSIEVHAAWRCDGTGKWPYLLNLDANGGSIEGADTVTYDAAGPRGSDCYVYLCAYPVPVRDGYTFTGWYTEPDGGKLRTRLHGTEFYEKNGDDFDWSTTKQVTLYAGWVKN